MRWIITNLFYRSEDEKASAEAELLIIKKQLEDCKKETENLRAAKEELDGQNKQLKGEGVGGRGFACCGCVLNLTMLALYEVYVCRSC